MSHDCHTVSQGPVVLSRDHHDVSGTDRYACACVQYVARLKKRGPGNEGIGSHRKVESVCT